MKKIALLIPMFSTEYSVVLIRGIAEYFNDKDFQLIITKTELPHTTKGLYDYQYWNSAEIIRCKEIDAYIVCSSLYVSMTSQDELESFLKTLGPRPIISIGVTLSLPNSYTVLNDSSSVYMEIVSHLKNVHGCKNLAFMSANSTKSEEALDRFEAFKKALRKNDLPYNEGLVFDGNFTSSSAQEVLSKKLRCRDDVKFDAIVAANDLMAVGCIEYLKTLNLKVPDDVIVTGFDNSDVALLARPKLTTIEQNIGKLGHTAASVAAKVLLNKKVARKNVSSLKSIFRQSCGCVDRNILEPYYFDYEGNRIEEEFSRINFLSNYQNDLDEKNNIITLMDMLKSANTLRQFYYNISYITAQQEFSELTINFFEEPVYLEKDDVFNMPSDMELSMFTTDDNNHKIFRPGIFFDPHKKINSASKFTNCQGVYILYPIFSAENMYGFLMAKLKNNKYSTYNVYLKILVTAISQAYAYTKTLSLNSELENVKSALQKNNDTLLIKNRTDELTGILNRRGFIEEAQRQLDILQETGKPGVIFFGDLDGLKEINDTYGHKMGDKALKLEAKALKKVFRSSDVVGRLSGDEFGIVAVGVTIENVDVLKNKVLEINKKVTETENLPFELSISLGGVDLQASSIISKLLSLADKKLYEEKRKKKAEK